MAEKTWRTLIAELGTDHLYAIRHRGEEGQSYSDPCRSVTKADGFKQAIGVLKRLDAEATMTVWTWGETLPDLFAELPPEIRAAHIRHGMAGVFGDRGESREQTDGAPALPPGRRWLSGQFTVFGGNETLVQTPWNDVDGLARDARADGASQSCEGYFQWPEWSGTSPWTSSAIARIAWSPDRFPQRELALATYAKARHGNEAETFLQGFLPLVRAGNARITSTPRKRLLVPYFLTSSELALLEDVRVGARAIGETLVRAASPLLDRDFVDLCAWTGVRQAHVFEAASFIAHLERDDKEANGMLGRAETTWRALRDLLAELPELSIIDAARAAARTGPLSARVVESFWTNACDFYGGYPLVMSPEAIELVYLDQLRAFRARLQDAARQSTVAALDAPGWFWHDFPDRAWADTVRRLPSEDARAFEREMKDRLQKDTQSSMSNQTAPTGPVGPSEPSALHPQAASRFVAACLGMTLPQPLATPPGNIPDARA